ncbi:MAG: sulfatase family protein [Promethearchaeota archaeon]|jgi:arylsulfatase A-like enzyme
MSEKMNLLFIITDQQRADALSCAGNPILKTPHIDSIANEGVRFTNYYCSTPICMPNRASFFTGLYPSVHGTRSNGINLNPNLPLLSGILSESGYHTCNVGKLHFNFYAKSNDRRVSSYEEIPKGLFGKLPSSSLPTPYYGFDEFYMANGHGDVNTGNYYEWLADKDLGKAEYLKRNITNINKLYYETIIPEELYPTTYIADRSIDFLERFSEDKYEKDNFFLHCSFPDPHHPVCPPGKYKDLYKPEDIELPSNFKDAKNLINHPFLGNQLKDKRFIHLLPQMVDEETAKIFTALTYGTIAMINDNVGRILKSLEKTGLSENTMIIFTSDHGDYCGDHGLVLKGPAHFRSVINMPLLWRIPGITKPGIANSLVSTVDLPITILNLLNVKKKLIPENLQGYDITSILKDPKHKIRQQVLIEHDEEITKDKVFRLRTLITENHRLTLYDGYDDFGDIFDLTTDSDELINLWDVDKELRNRLTEKLLREIISIRPRTPKRNAYN